MADPPIPRGIIDASVVLHLDHLAADDLPAELAVSAITLAELAAGPTRHPTYRSPRGDSTGCRRIYAAVSGAGRKARGPRSLDLLIAATALASNLPLYTPNPGDFRGTESLIEIVVLAPAN